MNENYSCADCGDKDAEMMNCDKKGNEIAGYLCFFCWRNKHPAFNPPKSTNPLHVIAFVLVVLFTSFWLYQLFTL